MFVVRGAGHAALADQACMILHAFPGSHGVMLVLLDDPGAQAGQFLAVRLHQIGQAGEQGAALAARVLRVLVFVVVASVAVAPEVAFDLAAEAEAFPSLGRKPVSWSGSKP